MLLAAAAAAALAGCAADDPEADPGATVAPVEDYAANMVDCLTDRGWPVEATEDGGVRTTDGIPTEQGDQYEADRDECSAQFGYDQPPTVTRAEAEEIFDTLLGVAECMRDRGYSVPERPSEQAFVEALMDRPLPIWHPYDAVPDDSISEKEAVREQCPVPD